MKKRCFGKLTTTDVLEANLAPRKQENVSEAFQEHFCLTQVLPLKNVFSARPANIGKQFMQR